jgi:GNAT superfamily N-acetyltransferase
VIVPADNPARMDAVRDLFKAYATSLSFNLCFQSFDQELAGLPGDYAPITGMLLLGLVDDRPAGCVAMRPLLKPQSDGNHAKVGNLEACEMKRLYVRPEFRGCGLGSDLVDSILRCAHSVGYRTMRLDTVPSEMAKAVEMYRRLGFVETDPYRENPVPGAKYMEINLREWIQRSGGWHRT